MLDWLLDPSEEYRQTGRSFAISIALVRLALRYPGRWVYFIDHVQHLPQRNVQLIQRSYVRQLCSADWRLEGLPWEIGAERFRVLASDTDTYPIADQWFPSEEALAVGGHLYLKGQLAELKGRPPPEDPRKTVWQRLLDGLGL